MARAVSEIEQEIRALPDVEKERLLRALLEELDGPPDAGAEQAWLDEIQRRSRELDEGVVEAIPAEKVFADLRAKLARRWSCDFFPWPGKNWTPLRPTWRIEYRGSAKNSWMMWSEPARFYVNFLKSADV
jgi:putative addiction module component (TIGR02574 family)